MRPFALFYGRRCNNGNACLFFIPFTSAPTAEINKKLETLTTTRNVASTRITRLPPPFSLGPFLFGDKTTSRLYFNTGDVTIQRCAPFDGDWSFELTRDTSHVHISAATPFVLYDLEEHKFEKWQSTCGVGIDGGDLTPTVFVSATQCRRENVGEDGFWPRTGCKLASAATSEGRHTPLCDCALLNKRQRRLLGLSAQVVELIFRNTWDSGLELSDETRLGLRHFVMLTNRHELSRGDVSGVLTQLLPACEKKLASIRLCSRKWSLVTRRPSEQALIIMSVLCLLLSRTPVVRAKASLQPPACILPVKKVIPTDFGMQQTCPTLSHVDSIASANTVTSMGSPSDHERDFHLTPALSSFRGGRRIFAEATTGAETLSSRASYGGLSLSPLSLSSLASRCGRAIVDSSSGCADKIDSYCRCWEELSEDNSVAPLSIATEEIDRAKSL